MTVPIFRLIFLFCVYAVTLTMSWSIIALIQFILHLILKPFSTYLYRKIDYYLLYSVYCQMICLSTWFTKLEIYYYIDPKDFKYFGKEHACVIMNHKYEIDWLFIGAFADQINVSGNFKTYIKKVVKYIPFAGWSCYMSDHIFLERSFSKDKEVIRQKTAELLSYSDPVLIILWPEGTRYTKSKHEQSLKFAEERKLPLLKHHLIPRSKGFLISLPIFREKLGAIYDVVLSQNPNDEIRLTAKDVLLGKKICAHLYVKRIPMEQVPVDEHKAIKFLNDMFVDKDELQEKFFTTGQYFENESEKSMEKIKLEKKYIILTITLAWMILVVPPFWYYLIMSAFESIYTAINISWGLLIFFITLWKVFSVNEVKKETKNSQ